MNVGYLNFSVMSPEGPLLDSNWFLLGKTESQTMSNH